MKPSGSAVTAKSLNWQIPEGKSGMVGFGSHANTLDALEVALAPGPFICGTQFTAADVVVGSAIGAGMMFGTIEKRPIFAAYVQRCTARPAYLRAVQIADVFMKSKTS